MNDERIVVFKVGEEIAIMYLGLGSYSTFGRYPQNVSKVKRVMKKFIELEYDPDKDVMLVTKKRKRGVGDWEDNW